LRTQIEALHFADGGIEGMQGDAAGELAFAVGKQKAASGRRVIAGKAGEFLVEILEAETEAEGLGVFEEEFAGLGESGRGFGLRKCKGFYHRGRRGSLEIFRFHFLGDLCVVCGDVFENYPISMPPFTFRTWPVM
jgi:hypothetical protein